MLGLKSQHQQSPETAEGTLSWEPIKETPLEEIRSDKYLNIS